MNAITTLLLLLTLPNPLTTLVLRSGERVEIEGTVQQQNGVVIFRASGGHLYSVPLEEVDIDASRVASEPIKPAAPVPQKRLKLAEVDRKRLIEELQQKHGGLPPVPQQILTKPPVPKTPEEVRQEQSEEGDWRRQARTHEESIRRAQENVALLRQTEDQLSAEIASLLSLGYKPAQFSYQTSRLQITREQIPWAVLEVQRAERLYLEFREDARKRGILPGWLR